MKYFKNKNIERPTSNVEWEKMKSQRVPLIKKQELLIDMLAETEELIKIFVTSIKTAEKKKK